MYGQTFCLRQLAKVNTSVSVAEILQKQSQPSTCESESEYGNESESFYYYE